MYAVNLTEYILIFFIIPPLLVHSSYEAEVGR
jgi:hypothetical protein